MGVRQADVGDQYTSPAYSERTSRPCYPLSFNSLSAGELPPHTQPDKEGVVWDMIFCSFALHLVPPQELFPLCYELATKARWLAVIAPHKKPEVSPPAYSGCSYSATPQFISHTSVCPVHLPHYRFPHPLSSDYLIVCHLRSHHPLRLPSGLGHVHCPYIPDPRALTPPRVSSSKKRGGGLGGTSRAGSRRVISCTAAGEGATRRMTTRRQSWRLCEISECAVQRGNVGLRRGDLKHNDWR
jgi:hypothetical protein